MAQEKSPQGHLALGQTSHREVCWHYSRQNSTHRNTHIQNFGLILLLTSSQFYSQMLVCPFGNLESRVGSEKQF